MSNGNRNAECVFLHMSKDAIEMKFFAGCIFVCMSLKVYQLYGIKIGMWDSNAKRFHLIPAIFRKNKGVSEIRIQILVPHPKMHKVPTFDVLASSVPEETGSTIVRHYPAKSSFSAPRRNWRLLFASLSLQVQSFERGIKVVRNYTRKAPITVRVIDSRPELSGKNLQQFLTSNIRLKLPASKYTRDQVLALQGF
ncbi:hypothetical protein TNCV_2218981 [Trichonephila clavipes]|nr:hypothetical protein TNCV_2218981 [Trichonephila clavipes]